MRRVLTIAVIVALPALAACGKGVSKQDFLAKADPICKRGNDSAASMSAPTDLSGLKDYGVKLADNITKTTVELDKLKYPGGKDGTAAKDMVKAMKEAAVSAKAVGAPVDKADYPGIEAAVTKMVDGFKAADDKARTLGSTECGKGESEASAKAGQTVGGAVKTAYIAKVDALCATANKAVDAIAAPKTFAEVKAYLDQAVGLAEKLSADIKAIPAPTTDKAKLDEVLSSLDALVAKGKEALAAAAANDQKKTVNLLNDIDQAGNASNAKADAYGFKDCGSQGG